MTGVGGTDPPFKPEFLWDAARLRLVWANRDGLEFWGEESLIDLSDRIFAPEDETARAFAARLAEIEEGGGGFGHLAFSPLGVPVWARADCSAEERGGRRCLRVKLTEIDAPDDALLARMRAGFDAAPEPLAVFAASGRALARNEADRRAFAAGPGALPERYADPALGRAALSAALSDGAFSHKVETRRRDGAEGAARHRVSLRRMRDPATGDASVIAGFHDLTDRPAPDGPEPGDQSPAGEGASARPGVEVAAMAHDLRAPLTAIQGFAEFMAMSGDDLSADQRAAYLADIQTAGRRMLALVDDLVALSADAAQPAGGPSTERAVDVSNLAEEAARLVRPRAAAAGVTLEVAAESGLTARGDADALHRILGNLLENALTHGLAEGGGLRLAARAAPEGAEIEVRDDGRGMKPERLAALMRPGARARRDAAGRVGGLGLSNCAALAEAMGARLDVTSAPGEGLTARLVLRP